MNIIRSAAIAAASALALTATASAGIIDFSVSDDTVTVGETFDVRVAFSSSAQGQFLTTADFAVAFDGGLFDFVSADFTDGTTGLNQLDLPDDMGNIGGFFDAELFSDGDLGVAAVSGNEFSFLQAEQADDFTIVSLTFLAEAVGTGTIGLASAFDAFFDIFDDPDGSPLMAQFVDTSVDVSVAAVPLPGAALFMLTGAAGLVARRKLKA